MNTPSIVNFSQAAELLNVSTDIVESIVNSGDLPAIGMEKNLIKLCDLNSFMGVNPAFLQNTVRPVDFAGIQRYTPSHSILIEDITETEWENMKKNGVKEHKPYWDKQKNRWCIALSLGKTEEGKRIRKVISAPTQAELWDVYRDFVGQKKDEVAPISIETPIVKNGDAAEMALPTYTPQQDVLVSECFAKFLKGLESSIVNRTYGGYIGISKYIDEGLGNLKMYELNREVIQDFLTARRRATYTKNGKSCYYGQTHLNMTFDLLKRFVEMYSDDRIGTPLLSKNYMERMGKPRTLALKKGEVSALTMDEHRMVLAAVQSDKMISCWVHIMANTGCRPSEALALQWGDIDLKKKTISITKALGKEADYDPMTKKRITPFKAIIKDLKNDRGRSQRENYQTRTLTISDATVKSISEWRNEITHNSKLMNARRKEGTEDFVFTGPNGDLRVYEDYTQKYNRLLRKSKINPSEINPYRFRHTACTELLKNRINIKSVQRIMGDNTPDMVLRVYANMDKESILQASEVLSEMMDSV